MGAARARSQSAATALVESGTNNHKQDTRETVPCHLGMIRCRGNAAGKRRTGHDPRAIGSGKNESVTDTDTVIETALDPPTKPAPTDVTVALKTEVEQVQRSRAERRLNTAHETQILQAARIMRARQVALLLRRKARVKDSNSR